MKQNQKIENDKKQGNVKDNAFTAIRELANMAGLTKNDPAEQKASGVTSVPDNNKIDVPKHETPAVPVQIKAEPPVETSVIATEVVVDGSICVQGNLDCRGTIKGDTVVKYQVMMSGKQTGNIQGQTINFANACVTGNITAKDNVDIDRGTKITGDVHGGSIQIDGQVTGMVCADGLVCLRKNAILNGDVQAGAISIEEGAQISGQINMKLS